MLDRRIAVRVGYKNGKPLYAWSCPTREDNLERHVGVRLGYYAGKPVYGFAGCLPALNPRTIGVRAGYHANKPAYLFARDCCNPVSSIGSSGPSSNVPFAPGPGTSTSSSAGTGDGKPPITCGTCSIPQTLTVTLTNVANCACMAGYSRQILYRGNLLGTHTWRGCTQAGDTENVGVNTPAGTLGSGCCNTMGSAYMDFTLACQACNSFGLALTYSCQTAGDCTNAVFTPGTLNSFSTSPFSIDTTYSDIGGAGGLCSSFPLTGQFKSVATE